jgi:hypothetical protein
VEESRVSDNGRSARTREYIKECANWRETQRKGPLKRLTMPIPAPLLEAAGAEPFGTLGGNTGVGCAGAVTIGGGLDSAFAAARAEIPGSCCCRAADADEVVELGREMGSAGGGASICAASSIAMKSARIVGCRVACCPFGGRG